VFGACPGLDPGWQKTLVNPVDFVYTIEKSEIRSGIAIYYQLLTIDYKLTSKR
jgi:hypothetical protein